MQMAKRWKLHFWDHWQSLKEIWFRRTCTETTTFIHKNKWVFKCPYEFWVFKLKDHAPINVKHRAWGWGFDVFQKFAVKLRRQISQGWTQEKHKKISPNKTLKSLFILFIIKIHFPVTAAIIRFNHNPCYTA